MWCHALRTSNLAVALLRNTVLTDVTSEDEGRQQGQLLIQYEKRHRQTQERSQMTGEAEAGVMQWRVKDMATEKG